MHTDKYRNTDTCFKCGTVTKIEFGSLVEIAENQIKFICDQCDCRRVTRPSGSALSIDALAWSDGEAIRTDANGIITLDADEIQQMQANAVLAKEERVSREYRKPEYDTVLHKAANQVAAVILLMFVGMLFALLLITPDERVTGRVSSGAVQEVIR